MIGAHRGTGVGPTVTEAPPPAGRVGSVRAVDGQ